MMAVLPKSKRLKKELNFLDVYALATGTTISGGFFILPGLAAAQAGPAVVLSYVLSIVPLIPAMFCMMELATAMPRAGGAYYFLDRTMGPMVGTIGGLGTWLSLILKTAFALIGMGAYLNLFIHGDYLMLFAIGFTLLFGIINLFGAKESGFIQIFLVGAILVLLTGFIGKGLFHVNLEHFSGFFDAGSESIIATAGLVYISYAGVTKVASVSEEVSNPERNLPLGMFLGFGTALLIYALGTYVMVGVLPPDELYGSLTPVADTADHMVGHWGKVVVTFAAIFAFASATNAGILSSSRYPLAMSRDHLLPKVFRHFSRRGTPVYSVLLTLGVTLLFLLTLDPLKIAKLASAFQLLMFALCCFAVIIMRESQIESYDPGFRSPWYPYLPLAGVLTPFLLILEMGWLEILFSTGLVSIGVAWYFLYARNHVTRGGAILHVFARLGQRRYQGLDPELRGILKEKGLRETDPFNELVVRAKVLDLEKEESFDDVLRRAASILSRQISYPEEKIVEGFMEGTKVGATPVSHGVALPHMRLQQLREPEMLIVRCKKGVRVNLSHDFWGEHAPEGPINAIFFLISPEEDPGQHLRILAKIAGRVDDENFMSEWLRGDNEQELKETLLREEYFMTLQLRDGDKSKDLIGKVLRDLNLPEGTLIALIRRAGESIVPQGSTALKKGDRLTVIGDQKGIKKFRQIYGNS